MFKRISIIVVGVIILLSTVTVYAQYKKIKAIGIIETNRKKPKIEERKQAVEDAKKKALDKYIDGLDSQRIRILNKLKEELYNKIDTYVPEYFTLNDGDWKDGCWRINVEVSINEAQIEELVNNYTQSNVKQKEETYLSFVFVAREVEDVKEYMDKTTERTIETESYAEDEDESSGEAKSMHEKVTGGSVSKKGEKVKYKGYTPEEVEAKVTEVFNKAEFEVVPTFSIDIEPDKFVKELVISLEKAAEAFGVKKEILEKLAEVKALKEGNINDGDLQKARKASEEAQEIIADKMKETKELGVESKKFVIESITHLGKGVKKEKDLVTEVKNLVNQAKGALSSASIQDKLRIKGISSLALTLSKNLPQDLKLTKNILSTYVTYAKAHNLKVPANATNLLEEE